MKCMEQKSGVYFIVEDINEVREQEFFLKTHKEFLEKFGEPDIKVFLTIKEAEQLLNQEVEKILDEYDYDNIGDVKVYADDEDSSFYEEAKKILNWYKQVWDWLYKFIEDKNEVDYKEFEAEYPVFEKGAE